MKNETLARCRSLRDWNKSQLILIDRTVKIKKKKNRFRTRCQIVKLYLLYYTSILHVNDDLLHTLLYLF